MKIVLIGAGSRSFGRGQVVDALRCRELKGRDVTFTLVDVSRAALDLMMAFSERVKEYVETDVALEGTTDRREALKGADYVIISVARRRDELWEQDYRVPLNCGFKHPYGENGGPGAIFHALRSLSLIMPMCEDVKELCPDALVLNFTNPEAKVLQAICSHTKINAAGICHGVGAGRLAISHYLGRPEDEFDIVSAGINHMYDIMKISDRRTGEDLRPLVMERLQTMEPPPSKYHHDIRLQKKIGEIFDVFTYPSDSHSGEYLAWGSTFIGTHWHRGREWKPVPLGEPEGDDAPSLEDYAFGKVPLDDHVVRLSGEITVPAICDIELDRGRRRDAVNVRNSEFYIENLPADAAVEVPATIDGKGLHPEKVGPIREPFAAFLRTQVSINKLVAEAYVTRSRKLLLQALLLDPFVNSVTAAEEMLDVMLKLQKEYVPEFQ